MNELIAELYLGMKKLHEKNIVLRNIDIKTIMIFKNKFDCFHLKFNIDMIGFADEIQMNSSGQVTQKSIPSKGYTYENSGENNQYADTTNDLLFYERNYKKYRDGFALGNVIDILRIVFQRKDPKLNKLITDLRADYSPLYNPTQYFYEYFEPNPAFYLNMIVRKFAGSYNTTHDKFLETLIQLKEIYHKSNQLFNCINESDEKNNSSQMNIILQKIISLMNVLDEFPKNDFIPTEISKTISKIEQNLNKIITHYSNLIQHQLGKLIINNLNYNIFDKLKNITPELFHDPYYSETIHACLQNLFNNTPKELSHLRIIENLFLLLIVRANIEKYINENKCIDSKNATNIIKICFLLSYKLSMDIVVKMEVWSQLLDINILQLIKYEREFLNTMHHQLIFDPFNSSYSNRTLENKYS